MHSNSLHIYCHIPFCSHACDYCNFYKVKPYRNDITQFIRSIDTEISLYEWQLPIETLYWGGGTPGLLSTKDLYILGKSLLSISPHPPREWTVEMAPSTVKKEKLQVLRELGVTRLSLGIQSFHNDLLQALGRRSTPSQIYRAYDIIQQANFTNVNLDLMFALPGQLLSQWKQDLKEAFRLHPQHISTYCLTLENNTPLYSKHLGRKEEQRDITFYKETWNLLKEAGYSQYEISNFAKPNYECRHNLNTWNMGEWVGLGPCAASQYQGYRYANPKSLQIWTETLSQKKLPSVDKIHLTPKMLLADSLIFGLRKNEGVDLSSLQKRFFQDPLDFIWEPLLQEGFLKKTGSVLQLTVRGRLIADRIGLHILEALE